MTTHWMMGDKFAQKAPHHGSIENLWEKKWKFPCTKSVYPFHDGKYEDFEKAFAVLIKGNIGDPYDDAYTDAFLQVAEPLVKEAAIAEASNDTTKASDLYMRAAVLYRISRFPLYSPDCRSAIKDKAWESQKSVYLKAASFWDEPVYEELIPHTTAAGNDGQTIPLYLRIPKGASKEHPAPAILLMTGLDGYRPDNTQRTSEFLERGWASVIAEVPGTADCPSDPSDPEAPDRLWTAVLDWMEKKGVFDMSKVIVWGLSTGGYYAVRVAHTHAKRLKGSVAQGAGTHHFFEKEWLAKVDIHEFPFNLSHPMALKHGYDSVEEFAEKAQDKFSLVTNKIVEMPNTRLLLINGTHDGLMPIEDSILLFNYSNPKEARFFPDMLHMGYPFANNSVYPWMEEVMTSQPEEEGAKANGVTNGIANSIAKAIPNGFSKPVPNGMTSGVQKPVVA